MARISMGGSALIMLCLGLVACGAGPAPSDVAEGVGFQDYQTYQARRAALRGDLVPQTLAHSGSVLPSAPSSPALAPALASSTTPQPLQIDADGTPLAAAAPSTVIARAEAAIVAAEATQRPAPSARGTTLELTSAPLSAAGPPQMQAAPPERPDAINPTLIDFALSTRHPLGSRHFSRLPRSEARHHRNCLAFSSADAAQDWFLQNGGPTRDRQTLDPDGDGFACAWDPTPYRSAVAAART